MKKMGSTVIIVAEESGRLVNIGVAACEACPVCSIYECHETDDVIELISKEREALKDRKILVIIDDIYGSIEDTFPAMLGLKHAFKEFDLSIAVLVPRRLLMGDDQEVHKRTKNVYIALKEGETHLKEVVKNITFLWIEGMKPFKAAAE